MLCLYHVVRCEGYAKQDKDTKGSNGQMDLSEMQNFGGKKYHQDMKKTTKGIYLAYVSCFFFGYIRL